jgi:CTP synthase (UTP-ammonia lyase)
MITGVSSPEGEQMITIGLIGDYNAAVIAHQAIPKAISLAGERVGVGVEFEWVPTDEIGDVGRIERYTGLWCVPGSPYRSMDGALRAIRFAREEHRPFLGTCGGFQHAVVEYARNVLGWADAEHAETAPGASRPVISMLECSLVEVTNTLRLVAGTRTRAAYGREGIVEGYHCRYGLNPAFLQHLTAHQLRVAAEDSLGEVRALELDEHPFYVTALFQPERAALRGESPPLVEALVRACAA